MPKTCSLEMARRLKDAGLTREPQRGDYFSWRETKLIYDGWMHRATIETEECTWLPTLSDLLDELGARGYEVDSFRKTVTGKYPCKISGHEDWFVFNADTREDAAGEALEWVLKQGKEAEHDD